MYSVLREKRHQKIRRKIGGTKECPRLAVFRSNQHIYAQIIDDEIGKTLVSFSDVKMDGKKMEKAYQTGKTLAEKALKNKIKKVVFDRGGFLYHGRIAQVAKGAREGGLEF
ncbi:50S ribosomal protein L18 [Candidatus Daviesbacteria bacterium]|nr:50S ribosomal protein L18 [Candidatus Daviesbacteria bacterium]